MTTNTNLSYRAAVSTATRALQNAIRYCATPNMLDDCIETIGDFSHLLTVLSRDWHRLSQEEAELARQAELAATTPTDPA